MSLEAIDQPNQEALVPDGGYLHLDEQDLLDRQLDGDRILDVELRRSIHEEVRTDASMLDPSDVEQRIGFRAPVNAVLQAGDIQLWVVDMRSSDVPVSETSGQRILPNTTETSADFMLVNPTQVAIDGQGFMEIPDRRKERPRTFGSGPDAESGNSIALSQLGVSGRQFEISHGGSRFISEKVYIMEHGSKNGTHLLTAPVTRPESYGPTARDEVSDGAAVEAAADAQPELPAHVEQTKVFADDVRKKILELTQKDRLTSREQALIDRTVREGAKAVRYLIDNGYDLPPLQGYYGAMVRGMGAGAGVAEDAGFGTDPAQTSAALQPLTRGELSLRREPGRRRQVEAVAVDMMPVLAAVIEHNERAGKPVDVNGDESKIYDHMAPIAASMANVSVEEARAAAAGRQEAAVVSVEQAQAHPTYGEFQARLGDEARQTVEDLVARGSRLSETEAHFMRYTADCGRWAVQTTLAEAGVQLPAPESDTAYAGALRELRGALRRPRDPGDQHLFDQDRPRFGRDPAATARLLGTIRLASAETLRHDPAERVHADHVAIASMQVLASVMRHNDRIGNGQVDARVDAVMQEVGRQGAVVRANINNGPRKVYRLPA